MARVTNVASSTTTCGQNGWLATRNWGTKATKKMMLLGLSAVTA
jgi:hypothetical protein